MLAGWVLDDLIGPFVGTATRLIVGLLATTVVWFVVLRWLQRLRDG